MNNSKMGDKKKKNNNKNLENRKNLENNKKIENNKNLRKKDIFPDVKWLLRSAVLSFGGKADYLERL